MNKISNYSLVGEGICQVELIKIERVNIIDANGVECFVEPYDITISNEVLFQNTSSGLPVSVGQDCCEAYGYFFDELKCWNQSQTPNEPYDPQDYDGGHKGIFSTIKGKNNISTNFNNITGFANSVEMNSSFSDINGSRNTIKPFAPHSKIQGDYNLLNPYSLNWTGATLEVYSRQAFKNNSIVGDYGIALGNGETFLSGGADSLYNTNGRSGSGHFVKHGWSDGQEIVHIGQNGMFEFDGNYLFDQSTNLFRLEFPSMISFEINVVGHDRGTTATRSQEYTFRKYSGTINNTNNSGTVSIKDMTLDTQKESANFTIYTFTIYPSYVPTDRPSGGGDLVYLDDGMFYMAISTNGASKLGIVDWTIDFKYTLVGLQNLGRASGQPIFTPTQISGCLLWVDAADPSTITHSSGSVSQWDDKSGNNHHLTQSTSAYEPTYSSVIPYPYIEFDGNNQVLGNTDAGLINVSDSTNTMFVVYESANTTTTYAGQVLASVNYRGRQYYGLNVNNSTAGAGGTSFMNKSSQAFGCRLATIPSTTKQVSIGTRDGVTRILHDQNGLTDTETDSSNTFQDMFSVGAAWESGRTPSADYTGKIYEIIVYDRVLTSIERNQVQNYLQTRWNT